MAGLNLQNNDEEDEWNQNNNENEIVTRGYETWKENQSDGKQLTIDFDIGKLLNDSDGVSMSNQNPNITLNAADTEDDESNCYIPRPVSVISDNVRERYKSNMSSKSSTCINNIASSHRQNIGTEDVITIPIDTNASNQAKYVTHYSSYLKDIAVHQKSSMDSFLGLKTGQVQQYHDREIAKLDQEAIFKIESSQTMFNLELQLRQEEHERKIQFEREIHDLELKVKKAELDIKKEELSAAQMKRRLVEVELKNYRAPQQSPQQSHQQQQQAHQQQHQLQQQQHSNQQSHQQQGSSSVNTTSSTNKAKNNVKNKNDSVVIASDRNDDPPPGKRLKIDKGSSKDITTNMLLNPLSTSNRRSDSKKSEVKPEDGFKYWIKDVKWKNIPEYNGDRTNEIWSKVFVNMKDLELKEFLSLYHSKKHRSSKELLENLQESKFNLFLCLMRNLLL